MASPAIVIIAGLLQQQPIGEIIVLRGDFDVDAYKIYSSTSDLIIQSVISGSIINICQGGPVRSCTWFYKRK